MYGNLPMIRVAFICPKCKKCKKAIHAYRRDPCPDCGERMVLGLVEFYEANQRQEKGGHENVDPA